LHSRRVPSPSRYFAISVEVIEDFIFIVGGVSLVRRARGYVNRVEYQVRDILADLLECSPVWRAFSSLPQSASRACVCVCLWTRVRTAPRAVCHLNWMGSLKLLKKRPCPASTSVHSVVPRWTFCL
jgi:hypothetical protein